MSHVLSLYNTKFLLKWFFLPGYNGAMSVPVLWDKTKQTIVSNDSADILHMFATEMNALCATEAQRKLDLCPTKLEEKIDELHSWINPWVFLKKFTEFRLEQNRWYLVDNIFICIALNENVLRFYLNSIKNMPSSNKPLHWPTQTKIYDVLHTELSFEIITGTPPLLKWFN